MCLFRTLPSWFGEKKTLGVHSHQMCREFMSEQKTMLTTINLIKKKNKRNLDRATPTTLLTYTTSRDKN